MKSGLGPLVSAIIITYKRPINILRRALISVINQTYKNLEIIIVNDNPSDHQSVQEIRSMIASFNDERIHYIVHEHNSGACAARNTGIMASKGKFIGLLDDDDEWLLDKTEKQLEGFVNNYVGLVYSPFYNISIDLKEELCIRGNKSGDLSIDILWTNCIGGSSMPLMKREVFDECGLFDENILSSQDYDMWVRIAQKYEMVCINEPLTKRYMQDESITTNFLKQKQGFYLFLEKHYDLYQSNPEALNYMINRRVNKFIEQGHIKEGWKLYKKAIQAKKISKYNISEPSKGLVKYTLNKIRK